MASFFDDVLPPGHSFEIMICNGNSYITDIVHSSGKKTYICSRCNKSCNKELELKMHIAQIHDGKPLIGRREKEYECSYSGCSKHFDSTDDLRYHLEMEHY